MWNENFSGSGSGPGSGGSHGDNLSPQAVFTSFKLPKPGQSNSVNPASNALLVHNNEQPLLPTRFSSPTGHQVPCGGPSGMLLTNSADSHGAKMFSAPLGGLPAMATQIAEAAEEQISTSINGETEGKPHSYNNDSDEDNIHPDNDDDDDTNEGNNNNENKTNSNTPTNKLSSSQGKEDSSNSPLESSPSGAKAIKARGTYYPLTAFPTSMPQGPVMRKGDESPSRTETISGRTNDYLSI